MYLFVANNWYLDQTFKTQALIISIGKNVIFSISTLLFVVITSNPNVLIITIIYYYVNQNLLLLFVCLNNNNCILLAYRIATKEFIKLIIINRVCYHCFLRC